MTAPISITLDTCVGTVSPVCINSGLPMEVVFDTPKDDGITLVESDDFYLSLLVKVAMGENIRIYTGPVKKLAYQIKIINSIKNGCRDAGASLCV